MSHARVFEFTNAPLLGPDDCVAEIPAGLSSAQALLQVLYEGLRLPGYFGFNWDALSDCLRDLHWLKQHRVIVRHSDLPGIPNVDLCNYLDVLAEAVRSWGADEEHCLVVVFPVAVEGDVARLLPQEG